MTLDFLRSHVPGLVTEIAPDAGRCCGVRVRTYLGSWPCRRMPRWRVKGHPAHCGQHAMVDLRRELQAATGQDGGGL